MTHVQLHDIILITDPCLVIKKTCEASRDPEIPNIRFTGRSIFDGRHWKDTYSYHTDVTVPIFSEDAKVFECVLVTLILPSSICGSC